MTDTKSVLEAAVRAYRDRALTAEAKVKELQAEVDRVWRAHDRLLDLTRQRFDLQWEEREIEIRSDPERRR